MTLPTTQITPIVYQSTARAMQMHRARCREDRCYAARTFAATQDVEDKIRRARDLKTVGRNAAATKCMEYAYVMLSLLLTT